MKVGIGYSNTQDSFVSGKIAAEAAIAGGEIENPALILAFCHHQVDADAFLQGLRTAVGREVPIVGGSAIGIITNDQVSYEGFPAGIAVLQSDDLKFAIACADHLDQDARLSGRKLAESLSGITEGQLLLFFYDSLKFPPTATTPPIMNASPLLIQGMEEVLAPSLPILGAGLLGDFDFHPPRQFCGFSVACQTVGLSDMRR